MGGGPSNMATMRTNRIRLNAHHNQMIYRSSHTQEVHMNQLPDSHLFEYDKAVQDFMKQKEFK